MIVPILVELLNYIYFTFTTRLTHLPHTECARLQKRRKDIRTYVPFSPGSKDNEISKESEQIIIMIDQIHDIYCKTNRY
jgi:hypothetical protein